MVVKTIIIFAIVGLLLPNFSFTQEKVLQLPETLEEAKEIGEKAFGITKKELPGILKRIWKEEVLPIWQKMDDWFKANIWPKIKAWFKREKEEIEKRKLIIEEEFKKEKKEIKEELPKVGKSLWEKFKELIK